MSKGKGWDLTSRRSLESAAEWIRKGSGALLVLVVRAEDVAFALDAQIAPRDARDMVDAALEGVAEQMEDARLEARARKRVKELQG